MIFPPPPVQTPFANNNSASGISTVWLQWFQAIAIKLGTATPAVSGSRGGNVALKSLLDVLDSNGDISDSTTP